MNLQALGACIDKELRLLLRDVHGLALLFVMPAIFILIMSLALKDQFEARAGKPIVVAVADLDQSAASQALLSRLRESNAFTIEDAASATNDPPFSLVIDKGFGAQLAKPDSESSPITLHVAADVARQTQLVVAAAIREALGRQSMEAVADSLQTLLQSFSDEPKKHTPRTVAERDPLRVRYNYGGAAPPTSVQQNVPAWLVFAVFFVVIPVSTAVIRERQVGTLRRIRTTQVGNLTLLLGKLIPYFAINQLQVVVMLAIGVFVVPLLGGDALVLHGSRLALALIAGAVSIAALGYALLIAVLAKTTEQATIIGGAGNIILAAIGGIMVPKFVMPATMQSLTQISPLSWGLNGFLDVLLRNGNVQSVMPEAAALTALGAACLSLAGFLQARTAD